MKPALSQVCSLDASLEQVVEDYAAGQCDALEVWLTSLEDFVDLHGVGGASRLFAKHGVEVPVASYQGGLLTSQGEKRKEAWELFSRRLELCQAIGAATLVVACDVASPLDEAAIGRLRLSLAEAAKLAGQRNVQLAIEFQARSALGNNVQTTAALVAEVGSPWLGICLDAFHYYVGPTKLEDLQLLTAENLFHVQVCDLADRPRELATDSDRILPGDGDIVWQPIVARLQAIGYQRHISVELLNPRMWQIAPRQFSEIALSALHRVLGLPFGLSTDHVGSA